MIPILVDYNKGGADWERWDSVDISTAIIKYVHLYDSYYVAHSFLVTIFGKHLT